MDGMQGGGTVANPWLPRTSGPGSLTNTWLTLYGIPLTAGQSGGGSPMPSLREMQLAAYRYGAPASASASSAPVIPDWIMQAIMEELTGGGAGAGGASAAVLQPQIVTPPVGDVLTEARQRRAEQAARIQALAGLLASTLPEGLTYYPGFEPGGLADIALGIVTGRGPQAAAGILPEGARRVQRRPLLPLPVEPDIASELPAAMELADRILGTLRLVWPQVQVVG